MEGYYRDPRCSCSSSFKITIIVGNRLILNLGVGVQNLYVLCNLIGTNVLILLSLTGIGSV